MPKHTPKDLTPIQNTGSVEKIKKKLLYELDYVYCYNCKHEEGFNRERFEYSPCEDCIRKSMGWSIKESTAQALAEDFVRIVETEVKESQKEPVHYDDLFW